MSATPDSTPPKVNWGDKFYGAGQPDGGAAFAGKVIRASSFEGNDYAYNPGMTMRQYYKAAALPLLVGRLNTITHYSPGDQQESNEALMAAMAGRIADAMIAEDEEHACK